MSFHGVFFVVLYVLLACTPAVLAALLGEPGGAFLYQAGRGAALTGVTILVLQAVLAARWKWLSRPFGLDIVFRFHRRMALFAGVLLIAHPLLLVAGGAGISLATSLDVPWYIWGGRAILLLLVVNLFLSTFRKGLGVKFEGWRALHGVAAFVLLVGAFAHSWFAGADLQHPAMRVIWLVLVVGALAVFAHHRFIRPALRRSHAYRVAEVRPEAAGVWTVELEPPEGETTFDYLPGQFHFITLHRGGELPEEEHHFTLSSSPTQSGRIASTIKAIGDFTSTIGDTEPGDTASVQGAFGRFSYRCHPYEHDLVFIAGGIGITPLMSMLRSMRDREESHRVVLLYGNRTESHIVFRDELAEIEADECPDLKVVHVLSRAGEEWAGETGHINGEMLERHVRGDLAEKVFYICGPDPLRESVIADLTDRGVPDGQIRTEIFRLVD